MNRIPVVTCCVVFAIPFLTGCEQKNDAMSMTDMKPPPRAAALDRLDVFVGRWEVKGEVVVDGMEQPGIMTGNATNTWEADRRVLLGRGEMTMGEGSTMNGLSLWTWDPRTSKYSTFWFDSMGGMTHGTGTYDEATRTFRVEGKSRNTETGETRVSIESTKMVGNNTMEWTYEEWNDWKTKKLLEIKGTNIRRP